MHAKPPHGSRDCFCCHCDGRGVRSPQPRGEQRRAPRAGRGLPRRGTVVGRCGGSRWPMAAITNSLARAWCGEPSQWGQPGVLACAARTAFARVGPGGRRGPARRVGLGGAGRRAGPAPEPVWSSVASSWVSSGA